MTQLFDEFDSQSRQQPQQFDLWQTSNEEEMVTDFGDNVNEEGEKQDVVGVREKQRTSSDDEEGDSSSSSSDSDGEEHREIEEVESMQVTAGVRKEGEGDKGHNHQLEEGEISDTGSPNSDEV